MELDVVIQRVHCAKDYYEILGVESTASQKDIKSAYPHKIIKY